MSFKVLPKGLPDVASITIGEKVPILKLVCSNLVQTIISMSLTCYAGVNTL